MVSKIKNIVSLFRYYSFNSKYFSNNNSSKNIILVELFNYKASIISVSLFVNEFCKIYPSKIVGFEPLNFNFKRKVKKLLNIFNPLHHYKLYKSFGVSEYIFPSFCKKKEREIYLKKIINNISSKNKILDIKIKGVKFGDLIYDSYLRDNNLPTIDFKSKHFQKYLSKSIDLFLYWDDFFDKNNVNGIVISHSVYLTALPGRIALNRNVRVYNIGATSCYKLSKDKPLRWSNFDSYPKIFKTLDKKYQKKAITKAKKHLNERFSGRKDILYQMSDDIEHAFGEKKNSSTKLFKTNKKKILIAAHCFNDAPHVHGNMLFSDFFEWMDYLGKKSNQFTKFEWCIKLHPSDYDNNYKFIKGFLDKYKALSLLPKNTNHKEILQQKISAVLTVHGSIGHEYPLFNIPVINAGNGPHFPYKFNYNPQNLKDYNKLINNIEKLKVNQLHKKEIYQLYFCHYLIDFDIFYKLPKSDEILNSDYVIDFFLDSLSNQDIDNVKNSFRDFILSGKRRMIEFRT